MGRPLRALVCTYGRPSGAALRLLRGLHDAGVPLLLRADDDRAGQAIVAGLLRALPDAGLWRYDRRTETPVDSRLYEEQLVTELIGDLSPQGLIGDLSPEGLD